MSDDRRIPDGFEEGDLITYPGCGEHLGTVIPRPNHYGDMYPDYVFFTTPAYAHDNGYQKKLVEVVQSAGPAVLDVWE